MTSLVEILVRFFVVHIIGLPVEYEFYKQCRELEQENKDVLVGFQEDYPGVLNGDNLADILKAAKLKRNKISIKNIC